MIRHLVLICSLLTWVFADSDNVLGTFNKVYDKCQKNNNPIKCLKIEVLKAADEALKSSQVDIMEGFSIVRSENHSPRSFYSEPYLKEQNLEELNSTDIDELLGNTMSRFLSSYRLQVNIPKLAEEGRGKKGKYNYLGPLIAGFGIKGFFMTLAYQGIAVMSGAAILIGKMALILSVLLGLKKLIHSGHEHTTVEIVKQPHYSHAHTHSVSHEGEHYFKNLGSEEEMAMQDRIYNTPYRGQVSKF